MIIVEKTEGPKIQHELMGNLLVLNNELYLNLSMYERDFPVSIDISHNDFGMLVMGLSRAYVAQIDIPAREYKEVETEEVDEETEEFKTELKALPFDVSKVTLTLWGV